MFYTRFSIGHTLLYQMPAVVDNIEKVKIAKLIGVVF